MINFVMILFQIMCTVAAAYYGFMTTWHIGIHESATEILTNGTLSFCYLILFFVLVYFHEQIRKVRRKRRLSKLYK